MKKSFLSVILMGMTAALFAKNISIQIIQNNPAAEENVCESSYLIEQSLIDYFFSSGHIVSSTPIFIGTAGDASSLKTALKTNAEGGMDYLVRVEVDYKAGASNPDFVALENIEQVSWKNYSVLTGTEISAGKERIGTVNRQDNNENGVASFANFVAAKINAGLKSK